MRWRGMREMRENVAGPGHTRVVTAHDFSASFFLAVSFLIGDKASIRLRDGMIRGDGRMSRDEEANYLVITKGRDQRRAASRRQVRLIFPFSLIPSSLLRLKLSASH